MAKLSPDGKSVTVEWGDTLSQIAADYAGGYNNYKKLAAINNISNPNLIYVGQVIKLTNEAGSGSGSASTSNSTSLNKAIITHFGLQSNTDNTLFAMWTWNKDSETASYKVSWSYYTADDLWFEGNSSSISVDEDNPSASKQSTYSIPNNAKKVRFKVKPISKTHTKNDTETNLWEASWSDTNSTTYIVEDYFPLDTPGSAPSVEIEKFKLTATLDNISIKGATHIEFQVIKDNAEKAFATKQAAIVTSHASYAFTIDAGGQYKVRCRAYNSNNDTYSDWSQYSSNVGTIPSTPEGITEIKASTETSVYISWSSVANATGYGIEYTTKKIYFDTSTEVKSMTVTNAVTNAIITGLSSGEEYFFRVKATNNEGDSGWTEIKSVTIGKAPAAPTTWSSTTTAITGNPVTLYWVHNAEDGSSQTYAELELYIGDVIEEHTIKNTDDEEEKDKTSQWILNTTSYVEGTSVKWRIRTAGITKVYGDWSVQRTIDIYAPATLQLSMTDIDGNSITTLSSFPFYISGLAGPKTQNPIGYHVSVVANEQYETVDSVGNPKSINKGEEIYSKYFDITDALLLEMTPSVIDLENNISYTVTCTVSMNSGLTAEESIAFDVQWADKQYVPNAEIGIDKDTMTANIRPYCEKSEIVYYNVTKTSDIYTKTNTKLDSVWGEPVAGGITTTNEQVYFGMTADGDEVYYCIVEERTPVVDVLLSVYRREFDGSFTELATGLDSAKSITITDPHPALDYARYRIIATTISTGAIGYYDPPGYPVGCKSVIIQWNEKWSSFETSEESALVQQPWSGSMLVLPYNIDVSESNSSDKSLVEYAGRSHPVTYYGTQLGVAANWNMDVPKYDKETVYALRRLARWMGDVYVREPSGSGYWASISVSFNQKHCDLVIPVTLNVTQVEGGA